MTEMLTNENSNSYQNSIFSQTFRVIAFCGHQFDKHWRKKKDVEADLSEKYSLCTEPKDEINMIVI